MKVKVTETKEIERDIKYICADLGVRYWEDGDINGEEDISYEEQKEGKAPRMPLAAKNPNAKHNDEQYRWLIKIDVETGNLLGWPQGTKANIHYKVCDDGTYWMETAECEVVHKIDDYVPKLFDFDDDSYGDYIIMTVDENGHIQEWYDNDELESRIQSFMEEEGF